MRGKAAEWKSSVRYRSLWLTGVPPIAPESAPLLRARDTHSYKLRLIPSKPLFRRLPNCSGYFWHLGMLLRSYPRRPVHNALVGFCLVCDDK